MRRYFSCDCARCGPGIAIAIFALFCVPVVGAFQSGTPGQLPAGVQTQVDSTARPGAVGTSGVAPLWWQLVEAHVDEGTQTGADSTSNYFASHPLNLLVPAGWKLQGQVDWPKHQGDPSLTFQVDSPDGRIELRYLPQESWNWSEDAATRANLQTSGKRVQPLPPTGAADYLRMVLLPQLHPLSQVVAIEPLPAVTSYLNKELVGVNIGAKTGAEQTGTSVPISSGDAARARITYLRNGVPVEEWIEIAVEHLQEHADNSPPWRPGETGRLYAAPSGPMINTFKVIECDILRAPQGTLERNSRILGTILDHLQQDDRWTRQASYEYWHGRFTDLIIYFQHSYFGEEQFTFDDPSGQGYEYFPYGHAWKSKSDGGFIVTDSASFNPNGKIGTQTWVPLKRHVESNSPE